MGSIRYIGSKARLIDNLMELLGPPTDGRFADLFCGTGVVARAAFDAGWPVVVNDNLRCAATLTEAQLIPAAEARFERLGGYQSALLQLESCEPVEGFIAQEYSPLSVRYAGVERRYFSVENASRIDAARERVRGWREAGDISPAEETLLLADLLEAANAVANIAGTYGCFLRKWTSNSRSLLKFHPRELPSEAPPRTASVADVFSVETADSDTVYLDPPYTKRQYASYYHVLETITEGDSPQVSGVCGLRPWKHLASPFCYKKRALGAMTTLVGGLSARRVLISYSSEGHMDVRELVSELEHLGDVRLHTVGSFGRYRPNVAASAAGDTVVEYLIELERAPLHRGAVGFGGTPAQSEVQMEFAP